MISADAIQSFQTTTIWLTERRKTNIDSHINPSQRLSCHLLGKKSLGDMGFDSQFALTVELTRLVPQAGIAVAAGSKISQQARDLKRSGSDLLVEEDLTLIFRQSKIDAAIEQRFRSSVANSQPFAFSELMPIVLWSGAGPTVRRALKDQTYFPMVIQLSLLCYSRFTIACGRNRRSLTAQIIGSTDRVVF